MAQVTATNGTSASINAKVDFSSTCLHPWYSWIHVVVVALSVYHPQIVQWPRRAAFLVLASDTRTRKSHRKEEGAVTLHEWMRCREASREEGGKERPLQLDVTGDKP